MSHPQSIVIVGSGAAGAKAAEAFRNEGFAGRLTMVSADPTPPYARPPLSKVYLRGQLELEKFLLAQPDDIDRRLETRVVDVDAERQDVVLEDGERIHYDRLLLATGAEPRRIQGPGSDLEGIHYLRDVGNSDAIREHAARSARAVVIGAGFIGSEVAASLRQLGLQVKLVEGGRLPLERVFGPEIGAYYRDLHVANGVDVLTDARLQSFEGNGKVERALLEDGRVLDCDFVVAGIGVVPRTELAERAGAEVANGVVTDEFLETRVPGVYAAGDIAFAHHPFYGDSLRVEHWMTAAGMGPVAAANMLGERRPFDALPYFYSDQFDSKMEYWGFAPKWDEVVFRGRPDSGSFLAFWIGGGRVLAGMSINVPDQKEPIEALLRGRREVERERLADPDIPLDSV